MRHKIFIVTILLIWVTLFMTSCTISPKEPKNRINIGVLIMGESRNAKFEGLRQGLSDLGLSEPDVNFSLFNADDNEQKLLNGAKELIEQRPDILVAAGTIEAEALAQNLKDKPIVPVIMIGVAYPGELQTVFNEQKIPSTGVDNGHIELTGKRVELTRLLFPKRNRILIIYDPRINASVLALEQAQELPKDPTYSIVPLPISGDQELDKLSKSSFSSQDALLILPSYYLESKFREIRDLSLARHIPVMGLYITEAEAGYTASYGIPYFDQGYQAARLVLRMSKEKRTIPFEMPDSVYLKLNTQALKEIGEDLSPLGLSFGDKINKIKE